MAKEARKEQLAREVNEAIANRHLAVDVSTAQPNRGRVIHLTTLYSLEVKGDTLVSYLPYYGRAYSVPYGGGKGLNFEAIITGWRHTQPKAGEHIIQMEVPNEEDTYYYLVTLYESGKAFIDVSCRNREHISFTGDFRSGQ